MNCVKYLSIAILASLIALKAPAQKPGVTALIEQALNQKNYRQADSLLQAGLSNVLAARLYDSLPIYAFYTGKVENKISGADAAVHKVEQFMTRARGLTGDPRVLAKIYAQAGEFFGSVGLNERAYSINAEAYRLAKQVPRISPEFLASIDSDMGTFAFRMGDVHRSQTHHRKAIQVYLSSKDPDYESLYVAANNMGSLMWMASKMDSAVYYFDIALNSLKKTDKTPINQYYRPAVLQNNLSALYNIRGETQKAIDAMKACIENLKIYLAIPEPGPKKPNSISFQFEATDNLGGIYKELGDYSQALSLEYYSYQQKLKYPDEDPAGVYKSQILLGQLYLAMKDHNKALQYLNSGLQNISKVDGDFLFWQADACNALAILHEEKGNKGLAAGFYEKADSLYNASLQGDYDDIYLEFLRNASLFYADNGQLPLALTKARKGYEYVKSTQGTETLLAFYQLLNLADVYLRAGDYNKSLLYSKEGLAVVEKKIRNSEFLIDSVKTELKKPKAVLLKVKAEYRLLKDKNREQLSAWLKELNDALNIIERRKALIRDGKDIGLMIQDHMELLDFIKKLTLDLYQLTGDQGYIDQLMNLQESGTYSRIRSRLDRSDSIQFSRIPPQVLEKEKALKSAIGATLENAGAHDKSMSAYFKAVDQWNQFQESIKKKYPEYYRMRYGSIFSSLGDVQHAVPEATTVVRYFYVGKDLFAVVLDRNQKQLVPLRADGIDDRIREVSDYTASESAVAEDLYQLYRILWAPLAPHIRNTRLVVIPDGILFNLNFEILTPKKIRGFGDLATGCLLSSYRFSYHYTLALVGQRHQPADLKGNFVAFAPGFLDGEKKRYLSTVKDSFHLDRDYMTLLPQPFTVDFVSRVKNVFNGTAYINDASTASSFRSFAGRHKIIHLGTHAESNNLSPEFSRLIFSKSTDGTPNSVYLHDIYNYDLQSELTVLTACETGKPGYQDGEGMISLAHAFNYAGSESILTGLWKIDEKASTLLMDAFYKNLMQGMDKDEALRQAKLYYLKTSGGRMLAPSYWAGLVLMGDPSPVVMTKKTATYWWWIGGGILLIAGAWVALRRRGSLNEKR